MPCHLYGLINAILTPKAVSYIIHKTGDGSHHAHLHTQYCFLYYTSPHPFLPPSVSAVGIINPVLFCIDAHILLEIAK
jgi:hypothetical protein